MKYRIAAVSYINTLPFLTGLQHPDVRDLVEVTLAHPARCAELLQNGEVDIALCPIGALPGIGDYHVITDYCIGCDGPVRTVSVYSNIPLEECDQIILSAESRTSNLLVQLINRDYWKFNLDFKPASSVLPSPSPPPSSAFLFIGDICFEKEKEFAYRTDLGLAWKEWTGLPFAFACWVSVKPVDPDFEQRLNQAFEKGIQAIPHLIFQGPTSPEILKSYLKENISYAFDGGKREAMERFLALAS
jgi:chorismate dehydratase